MERLYAAEYGCIIKYHMMLHFPSLISRLEAMCRVESVLPSCWVLERKHKGPKRFMNNQCVVNAHAEDSHIRELSLMRLQQLQDESKFMDAGLVGAKSEIPASVLELLTPWRPAQYAKKARCSAFEIVSVDDVVIGYSEGHQFVGKVCIHVSDGKSTFYTMLQLYQMVESDAWHTSWRTTNPVAGVVYTTDICCAAIYCSDGDLLTVLHGPRSRRPWREA